VTTLPKLMTAGDTLRVVGAGAGVGGVGEGGVVVDAAAVPNTLRLVMPPCEVTKDIVPLFVPAELGLNFTVNGRLSPGTNTTGVATPAVENPAALKLMRESVIFAFPAFRSVVVSEAEVPTFTLLKLSAAGVAVNSPTGSLVPSPRSSILVVGFSGSLLKIFTLPE
jgi:hypothetical protein